MKKLHQIKSLVLLFTLFLSGCVIANDEVYVGTGEGIEAVDDGVLVEAVKIDEVQIDQINPAQTEALSIEEWQNYAKMADQSVKESPVFITVDDDVSEQLHEKVKDYDYTGTELEAESVEIKSKFY